MFCVQHATQGSNKPLLSDPTESFSPKKNKPRRRNIFDEVKNTFFLAGQRVPSQLVHQRRHENLAADWWTGSQLTYLAMTTSTHRWQKLNNNIPSLRAFATTTPTLRCQQVNICLSTTTPIPSMSTDENIWKVTATPHFLANNWTRSKSTIFNNDNASVSLSTGEDTGSVCAQQWRHQHLRGADRWSHSWSTCFSNDNTNSSLAVKPGFQSTCLAKTPAPHCRYHNVTKYWVYEFGVEWLVAEIIGNGFSAVTTHPYSVQSGLHWSNA